MTGEVGVLNVGCGDTKLTFDPDNPQECIRAARIVTDMLRRGYALLVAVERGGKTVYQRAYEFKEDTFEYIIADLDPVRAAGADEEEAEAPAAPAAGGVGSPRPDAVPSRAGTARRPGRRKAIAATGARAVAVARSAGG